MEAIKEKIKRLADQSNRLNAIEIIQLAFKEFGQRVNFASSLGEEDQVITDMISKIAPTIEFFTLDTGRLHPETYDLMAKTQKRYKFKFTIYYPDTVAVEKMV